MTKNFAFLFAALLFVGCRANPNAFDPFAPYGAQCIPPPPTGSIGAGSGYYQPPAGTAMQPVPSLSSQAPAEPRTSSLPSPPTGENWESADKPGLDFGAQAAATPPRLADAKRRPIPTSVRSSASLAWEPPFHGNSSAQPTYNPMGSQVAAVEYVPPINAPLRSVAPAVGNLPVNPDGYVVNPVRPAVARDTSCNCDPLVPMPGGLQPQPMYPVGQVGYGQPVPPGSSSRFATSGNLQWR